MRQATAVITAEKGLNASSRIKLESLAKHLKLPSDLFEHALVLLQSNDTNLTHYEKAFIKFLDSELGRIKGGVISLGMELEAIDLAERKYQINSTRAEQLIEARSQAAGISRISPDEAAVFAERIIVERVNKLPAVDDGLLDDLYRIGKKWGYQRKQVDRVIFRQIDRNRAQRRTTLLKRTSIALGLLLLVCGVGTAFVTGQFKGLFSRPVPMVPPSGPDLAIAAEAEHNSSTFSSLQYLARNEDSLNPIVKTLGRQDAAQRKTAFEKLTDKACSDQRFENSELPELVSRLYFEEQSDVASSGVLAAIRDKLQIQPVTYGVSVNQLKENYRANRMLGYLCFSDAGSKHRSTTRYKNATSLINELIKIPISDDLSLGDYLSKSEAAIAVDHWNLLNQTIWSPSSVETAVLYGPILTLTKSKLEPDTLNNYRDETLVSLIEVDASDWSHLREPIRETVSRCDQIKLNRWISAFVESDNVAFQDFLAQPLLKRIDAKPRSVVRKDVYAAIANYEMTVRDQLIEPVTRRDALLSKKTDEFLSNQPIDKDEITPDLIAITVLQANLQLAFCAALEDATHIDDSSFALVDRLNQTASSDSLRLRELISLSIDRRSEETNKGSATASDRSRKKSALAKLERLRQDSAGTRKIALNQLAGIATRFDRISYREAETIATYVLSDLGTEELQNIQLRVEAFSHWANLTLAIADKLPEANVGLDQALTISRLLLGRDFDIQPQDSQWKRTLQSSLYSVVATQVSNDVDLDPDNVENDWNRLQIYLNDAYRDRLMIVKKTDFSEQSFSRLEQFLLELAQALAQENQSLLSRLENSKAIIEQASDNEIAKTVLAGQFLIQVVSGDFESSEFEASSRNLLSQYQSTMQKQSFVGEQLYHTELVLLRMFALKRELLVKRLRERSQ